MKYLLLASMTLLSSNIASAAVTDLSCFGTEPFYALKISATSGTIKYTSPDDQTGVTYAVSGPNHAHGMPSGVVMVFKGQNQVDVSATLISEALVGKCNDGMSENEYPYHLVYTKGDVTLYGCCKPAQQG